MFGFLNLVVTKYTCTSLPTVAWIVASMHVQVYMYSVHAWHLAQRCLHLQSLLVTWVAFWILASLCDGAIQHASSF